MHTCALFMYLPIQMDRPRHDTVPHALTTREACACIACLFDEARLAGRSRNLPNQSILSDVQMIKAQVSTSRERTKRLHTLEPGCTVHEQLTVSSGMSEIGERSRSRELHGAR